MRDRILTRMGDGQRIEMSCDQIKEELLTGTRDAAQRAEISELTPDDLELLFDITADPSRIVGVAPGQEVIVTDDACSMLFYADQENRPSKTSDIIRAVSPVPAGDR